MDARHYLTVSENIGKKIVEALSDKMETVIELEGHGNDTEVAYILNQLSRDLVLTPSINFLLIGNKLNVWTS